jgi:major membrane immunogen (membrane-anchored lipoprotein)
VKALFFTSLLIALALLLAGCGSNKKNDGTASPAAQGGQRPQIDQQAFARFQHCLKDHGVTLPNGRPQGGQSGQRPTFDAKTQKAFRACNQYLPSRPQRGFGGQGFNGPST